MDTHPLVSVIIPTYRRRDSVARTLRGLSQQTMPAAQFDVTVVIDGSEDGTRELLADLRPPFALRSLWQPNRGRAAAINAGIQAATGPVLIFLDDDMEPASEFVEAHCRAHQGQPRLGIMGAVPIIWSAGSPPLVTDYMGPKFNRHLEHLARPDRALVLRDFYSGNFSVRRAVVLEVGAFDEAFQIYGNEDLELSIRLTRAAVRLQYSAAALAHQHYTKDFAALARDTIAKGRTAVLLASKHPDALVDLQLSSYDQASPAWRAARAALLALTRNGRGLPALVAAATHWLEPFGAGRILRYQLALDYCYWVGAEAALRENQRSGQGLRSLAGLARP